jgi:glycosyltransferase involved in cell wall biosynthesis
LRGETDIRAQSSSLAEPVETPQVRTDRATPVISAIMPTYNGERFLRPAIESILNQSFSDFELIVVDDGSTDRSPQILREFAERDSRIIVLTNEHNLGIARATNRGLAAARSSYVALQDHDDISLPQRFQTQLDFLASHPEIALVGSAATLIDDAGNPYGNYPVPCDEVELQWNLLFAGDCFHYTSILLRRDALLEIGGYDEDPAFRYSEAWAPAARLAARNRVANLPDPLVYWRRHADATSLQHRQAQAQSGEAIRLHNLALIAEHLPHYKRSDISYYIQGLTAFTSTPAGQFPALPARQVIDGFRFLCEIQDAFYKMHHFPRAVVARHRQAPTWTWGKHALALALRAPWDFASRIRIFPLAIRCLLRSAAASFPRPEQPAWKRSH